jgi:hypothetical protein
LVDHDERSIAQLVEQGNQAQLPGAAQQVCSLAGASLGFL